MHVTSRYRRHDSLILSACEGQRRKYLSPKDSPVDSVNYLWWDKEKTSPGKEVKLLPYTLHWMPHKGPSNTFKRISMVAACVIRVLQIPAPFLWMWALISLQMTPRGPQQLMGPISSYWVRVRRSVKQWDSSVLLAKGSEWPGYRGILSTSGLFPCFCTLGQHHKSDWNCCPRLVRN